jgi:hypothetical protein
MENFLKEKIQQDFLDCVRLDKAILMGQIPKESGTLILFDLIDYVKSDIATLDKESWIMLNEAERKLLNDGEKRKDLIRENRRTRDSSERRDLEIAILREDYTTCKGILYFIQNICYKKGWFQ